MNRKELQYALALQDTKGVGSITARKLIDAYGGVIELYEAHQQKEIKEGINAKMFLKLFDEKSIEKAKKELEKNLNNGVDCVYYQDEKYPKNLLNCSDAPLVLFQDGDRNLNQFDRVISIVGTRNITSYGRGFCKDLLQSIKEYAPLIVSGYAFGVDICAHLEALENNLPTVAVLAHGYGTVYPSEHKKFYHEVKESGGFLSEFGFDEPPYRENFLKRNRIVAGISQATIVVESAEKGGALVTANIANSYYRDVFAVPGRTTDVYSKGCNNLIKEHKASLITSGKDLVEQLGWKKSATQETKTIQPQLFVDLDGEEKIIYDLLATNAMYVDEVARTSNIPIYKVSNVIFQLEIKGLIQVLPGKLIKRI